jgi:MOSC domain-containing protein YiiM
MPSPSPLIVSIQVGLPQTRGTDGAADAMDRPWTSGFVKEPVQGRVHVGRTGVVGDGQADLRNHGGVDKAVLAYSADHYPWWRRTLAMPELSPGAFGENLTIAELDETGVCIGDVWRVGEVRFEVAQPRQPCWKLARRWRLPDLPQLVLASGRGGWYLRALDEGTIEAGLTLELLERPWSRWTVAEASSVMMHRKDDVAASSELAAVTALPQQWRAALAGRGRAAGA